MSTAGTVPQNPPLGIIKQGNVWVLEEYRRGRHDGETFSTHDTHMDALRAAKSKMESDVHPCTVRWESTDSVRDVYWNPLFERADARYDELLKSWTVVPAEGTCAMAVCSSRTAACERAKEIQRDYDFKLIRVYDRLGADYEEREHRFLRHDITKSGVRFDTSALEAATEDRPEAVEPADTTGSEVTAATGVGPATPGRLGVSVPDVTKVEFVDTDGVLNQYATPWGDGTDAEILAVSQKYADVDRIQTAFAERLDPWLAAADTPNVASIHESGTEPTSWVAYRVGETTLAETGLELTVEERARVLGTIVDAVTTVADEGPVCGIRPENVRLRSDGDAWHVTVADWGIEWAVSVAHRSDHVTPYTAPEQLDGNVTGRTAVYQVGAVAFWLFCEFPPVEEPDKRTLRMGDLRSPQASTSVSSGVESVLERALATRPADRYGDVREFYRELTDRL